MKTSHILLNNFELTFKTLLLVDKHTVTILELKVPYSRGFYTYLTIETYFIDIFQGSIMLTTKH